MRVKDSVEVALELNEKELYSHIAHESAEDMIRIISSIDAERAKLRGEIVYHQDDWDLLIRERIRKGKRHTAFDFYNPILLEIWEGKVKAAKRSIGMFKYFVGMIVGIFALTIFLTFKLGYPVIILGLGILPLLIFASDYSKARADLFYYELVQLFIYELKEIIKKFELKKDEYPLKLYSRDYNEIEFRKSGKVFIKI
ncbi:hypothetical protein PNA2_1914 [Pyrococcus sp. NA2]|uniref:hypothetical protein n=1 Tax=Pyrococcus sp. (strain NA2) TaxID=342949 RepID=UPI000209AD86|nr:hypothetical protein [Pyrococcus sp. NA2]AEC52828.1 hypothetical protein PNA2_1914 [Pyrococcus sp. NA2]